MGHKVRNVINGRHRVVKQPLNLFLVDMEPADNDREIYNIQLLQNKTVATEPPSIVYGKYLTCPISCIMIHGCNKLN
jgi:hypothetical protein